MWWINRGCGEKHLVRPRRPNSWIQDRVHTNLLRISQRKPFTRRTSVQMRTKNNFMVLEKIARWHPWTNKKLTSTSDVFFCSWSMKMKLCVRCIWDEDKDVVFVMKISTSCRVWNEDGDDRDEDSWFMRCCWRMENWDMHLCYVAMKKR